MRLLLTIPYYAPAYAFGGSVTVAETVVSGFLEAGHEVTVATTDVLDGRRRLPRDAAAQPPGAEVVRFRNVSHAAAARLNGYSPRGLRPWIAENVGRFDVVLLHDVYSALSVISARAAVRAGVPFVLQPLGTLSPARERGRPVVKRVFLSLWGVRTLRSAAALMYLADHEAQDFLAAGAPRERLLHMPLPLELPSPTAAQKSQHPTVSFVGRLHPIKRVDRLIEAIAIAREEIPDVRLEIVGPGDRHRQTLETQAGRLGLGDTVVFHGFVDGSEKLRILRRAHVSALLSRSEGLPMAVLEAMACGIPVVLSRGCHLDEVQARAGLVVPDSAHDAAAALVRLLRDSDLRRRLGEGATAFARGFRRELVMPEMIGALERIAAIGGDRS